MLRIGALPFLIFAFAFPCNAQGVGSPPVNVNSTNTITNPTVNTTFISGKVMVDDGTDVPDQVSIESVCNGRTHIETVTDSKGHRAISPQLRTVAQGFFTRCSDRQNWFGAAMPYTGRT